MELTELQKTGIEKYLHKVFSKIISDAFERTEFVDNIIDYIVEDIEETADWNEYEADEINLSDINIALARCLLEMSYHL